MSMSKIKRERPKEGFYSYSNSLSSVDILDTTLNSPKRTRYLEITAPELPEGVYEIERVIHHRRSSKVGIIPCP